ADDARSSHTEPPLSVTRGSCPCLKGDAFSSLGRVLKNRPAEVRFSNRPSGSSAFRLSTASLIGRLGQALSGYPPLQCRCRSRARASLRTRHQGPCMGLFESSRVTHFFHRRVLGSISPGLILTASSAMMQSG